MEAPSVPKQSLLAELRRSLLQALNHAASRCEVPELCASLSSRIRSHGTDVQVSVVWSNSPHPVVARQQWDRLTSTGLTQDEVLALREDVARLCAALAIELAPDCGWHQPPPDPPIPALYRYHPCRLQALRSYGERLDAAVLQVRSGSEAQVAAACREIVRNDAQQGIRTPLRYRVRASQQTDLEFHRYVDAVIAFVCFSACGRALYDFSPPLTHSLRATDSDKIHLNDIRLPHPAMYLHFGRQADLNLGETWAPEGAYVRESWSEDGLREIVLTFVAVPATTDTFLDFDTQVEPVFQVCLQAKAERRSLRRVFIARLIDAIDRSATERANGMAGSSLPRSQHGERDQREVLFARRRPYGEMINLALNAMAFLSMCPHNVAVAWPAEAPGELVETAMHSRSPRARAKARQELQAQGYCPVNACQADSVRPALGSSTSTFADPFVVRGYWSGHETRDTAGGASLEWVPPVGRARAHLQPSIANGLRPLSPHTKGMRMH